MTGQRITDNLDAMLGVLPPATARRLGELDRSDELLEIILYLGRVPTARFLDREEVLSEV